MVLMLFIGCVAGGQLAFASGDRIDVVTVNYPLAYFASRIGGDAVDVQFPAPPEGDPAGWNPAPEALEAFRDADMILLNGAGYAQWPEKAPVPADRLVDTSAGFADRYIISGESETHSHGPGDAHSHEPETAFTTWLDPQLAVLHAAAIRDALSAARPDSAAEFDARFASLEAELNALDREFARLFEALGDTPVVFSHPVYQYLEARYGINGISVHWEPDQSPSTDDMVKFADRLMDHPAQVLIWEGDPMPATVAELSTMAIDSFVLDPCGNRPEQGDYMTVMQNNIANLRAAIKD
jgi:zinc transport system substrate-binding protein